MEKEIYQEFISLDQVAKYLGVNVSTIYRYMKDETNPLPTFQLSEKTIRVKKSELQDWLENYRREN